MGAMNETFFVIGVAKLEKRLIFKSSEGQTSPAKVP
jgi:hypothetical protein